MARREHEARTKRGGSASYSTEAIYRSERPSEDRKVNKIFNFTHLPKSFLKEFEGTFCKKFPQEKHVNYNFRCDYFISVCFAFLRSEGETA